MSRTGREGRSDNRSDTGSERERTERTPSRPGRIWSPSRTLTLPRSRIRQPVIRDRTRLRQSEVEVLSRVGAFRAVAVRDLNARDTDLRSLRDQGLLQTHTLIINGQPEPVALLTQSGRSLLESARDTRADDQEPEQQFYAGLVKPRELAHDAQLYRMFETERAQLERDGASVLRVVLDYELKADYHAYVHQQEQAGVDAAEARRTFAEEHHLPFASGHISFPDVRIEYESDEGLREYRDLELATEHYSRARIGGKQAAGFRVYRAAGARGGASKRGATPADPHHLQWLG